LKSTISASENTAKRESESFFKTFDNKANAKNVKRIVNWPYSIADLKGNTSKIRIKIAEAGKRGDLRLMMKLAANIARMFKMRSNKRPYLMGIRLNKLLRINGPDPFRYIAFGSVNLLHEFSLSRKNLPAFMNT
jgi:hypothetical protein